MATGLFGVVAGIGLITGYNCRQMTNLELLAKSYDYFQQQIKDWKIANHIIEPYGLNTTSLRPTTEQVSKWVLNSRFPTHVAMMDNNEFRECVRSTVDQLTDSINAGSNGQDARARDTAMKALVMLALNPTTYAKMVDTRQGFLVHNPDNTLALEKVTQQMEDKLNKHIEHIAEANQKVGGAENYDVMIQQRQNLIKLLEDPYCKEGIEIIVRLPVNFLN